MKNALKVIAVVMCAVAVGLGFLIAGSKETNAEAADFRADVQMYTGVVLGDVRWEQVAEPAGSRSRPKRTMVLDVQVLGCEFRVERDQGAPVVNSVKGRQIEAYRLIAPEGKPALGTNTPGNLEIIKHMQDNEAAFSCLQPIDG